MQNKNKEKIFWLVLGVCYIIFSLGILIATSTDSHCQVHPTTSCQFRVRGTILGFILGIIALSQFFIAQANKNKPEKPQVKGTHSGLLIFGIALLILSIIMVAIETPAQSGAIMSTGFILTILAIPVAIAGIITISLGLFYALRPTKNYHPILSIVFIIGTIVFLLFTFFS